MPKDALDIAVNAGDLVGIIQKKDPMGNTKRWFVDNGITQVHIYFIFYSDIKQGLFFFQKDDITIRFRFSPSSDADWCLTDSQH